MNVRIQRPLCDDRDDAFWTSSPTGCPASARRADRPVPAAVSFRVIIVVIVGAAAAILVTVLPAVPRAGAVAVAQEGNEVARRRKATPAPWGSSRCKQL